MQRDRLKKVDPRKVYIVGVGFEGKEGLSKEALSLIERAKVLYGGKRLLSGFVEHEGLKIPIGSDIPKVVQEIKKRLGQVPQVVLASGDPLFFGIGETLLGALGKEAVEVLPGPTSLQLAFARIKEGYSNAVFVSLHARGLKELFAHVPHAQKIGILTDPTNTPKRIASELLERVGPVYMAYVLENLGYDNERLSSGELKDIALKDFDPLNVMVLLKKESTPKEDYPILGVLDEEFAQRTPDKGLITKSEVRAISLSKLGLTETSVVYDIGAGSGSVGLEAARIAKKGRVYAIEKNPEDLGHIRQNRLRLSVANLEIIEGEAPEALKAIPEAPDAVFVGGSGGKMEGILKEAALMLRPKGRIVINIARIETLYRAHEALKRLRFETEVTLVQAARSKELMGLTRLLGLNPVFIVTGFRRP